MAGELAALLAALKTQGTFKELRTATDTYLEGVILREHLPACEALLAAGLGPAAKLFGQPPKLDRTVKAAVEKLGGVRQDQGLYFKPGADGQGMYALLWPWGSDANRVTLKVGACKL